MSSADLLTKQLLVGRGACSLKLESWMKDFRFQMVSLATFWFAKNVYLRVIKEVRNTLVKYCHIKSPGEI